MAVAARQTRRVDVGTDEDRVGGDMRPTVSGSCGFALILILAFALRRLVITKGR